MKTLFGIVCNAGNDINGNSRQGVFVFENRNGNRCVGSAKVHAGGQEAACREVVLKDPFVKHPSGTTVNLIMVVHVPPKELKWMLANYKPQRV